MGMEAHEKPRPAAAAGGQEVVARLRERLRGRTDVHLALLFGSYARGVQRPDSDVDVAVQGPGVDRLELAAELSLAVKREVQVVPLEGAGYPLVQALLRDSVVVHEGRRGAAAEWRTAALLAAQWDRPWYERMLHSYLRRVAEEGLLRG